MKQLELFSVDNASRPVALVSPNLPEFIKDVIRNNWDKTSSGFADRFSMSDVINEIDDDTAELLAELIQEQREEYASQL